MAEEKDRSAYIAYVRRHLRNENIWTKLWSLAYHGSLFGAAFMSAAAALLLQLKTVPLEAAQKADLASVLAAVASFIGVIAVSGGFERKWRANRFTKCTLEQLEIDLMDNNCNVDDIRQRLKDMRLKQHIEIAGKSLGKDKEVEKIGI